jgi:hypothetical protein
MSIEEADTEVAADIDTGAGAAAVDTVPAAGTEAEPDIEAVVGTEAVVDTEAGPDTEAVAGTGVGSDMASEPAVAVADTEAEPDTEAVPAVAVVAVTEAELGVELAPAVATQTEEAVSKDTRLPLSADRGKQVTEPLIREGLQVPAHILVLGTAAHRIRRVPRDPEVPVNNWLAVSQL